MIDSQVIKKKAEILGADLCGIATVNRFVDAPKGFHPCDIFPECKSVISIASRFPLSTLKGKSNVPYTMVRNMMVEKMDRISFLLSNELEAEGIISLPIPCTDPYEYYDPEKNQGKGILSLKHTGELAGLGVIGKNTLLINNKFGNMIWLSAILISVELESDPLASYKGCFDKCTLCIDKCPQKALDGTTLDQKLCRVLSVSETKLGGWILSCNLCRKICPNHTGLKE